MRGEIQLAYGERRDRNRSEAEAREERALKKMRGECETPREREARERREDAKEHSTEARRVFVADNEPKFSDGVARKCFTCKGWFGGGWASCTVHNYPTQTHLICDDYERHPTRYPALPAGEPTGRVDPRAEG